MLRIRHHRNRIDLSIDAHQIPHSLGNVVEPELVSIFVDEVVQWKQQSLLRKLYEELVRSLHHLIGRSTSLEVEVDLVLRLSRVEELNVEAVIGCLTLFQFRRILGDNREFPTHDVDADSIFGYWDCALLGSKCHRGYGFFDRSLRNVGLIIGAAGSEYQGDRCHCRRQFSLLERNFHVSPLRCLVMLCIHSCDRVHTPTSYDYVFRLSSGCTAAGPDLLRFSQSADPQGQPRQYSRQHRP